MFFASPSFSGLDEISRWHRRTCDESVRSSQVRPASKVVVLRAVHRGPKKSCVCFFSPCVCDRGRYQRGMNIYLGCQSALRRISGFTESLSLILTLLNFPIKQQRNRNGCSLLGD